MSAFLVTLWETSLDGDKIGEPFLFPALPYPGLRIGHGPGIYEAVRVHVEIPQPGSASARSGEPPSVDVIVIPSSAP